MVPRSARRSGAEGRNRIRHDTETIDKHQRPALSCSHLVRTLLPARVHRIGDSPREESEMNAAVIHGSIAATCFVPAEGVASLNTAVLKLFIALGLSPSEQSFSFQLRPLALDHSQAGDQVREMIDWSTGSESIARLEFAQPVSHLLFFPGRPCDAGILQQPAE